LGVGHARNQPCWCGSGKKLKKCCRTEKPRQTSVTFDMGKPVAVDGIRFGPGGEVQLRSKDTIVNPISAHLEVSYERRNKKPKITFHKASKPGNVSIDPHEWVRDFNIIYVADTNAKKSTTGAILAVGCAIEFEVRNENSSTLLIERGMLQTRFQPSQLIDAEKTAIVALIRYAISKFRLLSARPFRIAIITDNDLGSLADYNDRIRPLVDGFFVPPAFQLIYASADSARDTLWNTFITRCDKTASKVLKR
jgi:hypothetical protein